MAQHIIDDLKSVIALFKSRGDVPLDLQATYANSMAKQLSTIASLSTSDAKTIIDVLKKSPYGETATPRLLSIIDNKLQSSSISKGAKARKKSGANTTQFLHKWWNYLSRSDWALINDPRKTFDHKTRRAVFRSNRLGCSHPDEQTMKWLLATLLIVHYDELPSNSDIFKKLAELKHTFACERTAYALEITYIYPDDPDLLDEAVYQHAYDEDDPPITVELHGVSTVADRVALRKNSALLMGNGIKNDDRPDCITISSTGKITRLLAPIKHEQPSLQELQALQSHAAQVAKADADDMPKTEPERKLYANYKADLWKLRARASGVLASLKVDMSDVIKEEPPSPRIIAPPSPRIIAPGLSTMIDADGALCITSRTLGAETTAEPVPIKSEAGTSAVIPPAEAATAPTFDDLDPYAQAAIAALNARNKKQLNDKKLQAAEKKKLNLGKVMKCAMKRADKAVKPEKAVKPDKAAKLEAVTVSKKNIMNAMPSAKSGGAPVLYNGGVVYTIHKLRKFRGLRERSDRYTETSACWGKTRTMKEAWSLVISAIDKHQHAKKK
jgi:hypothetical protein